MFNFDWFFQLGLMGIPLAICSVVMVAIFLEKVFFYIKVFSTKEENYQKLASHLTEHQSRPKPIRDEIVSQHLADLQRRYQKGIGGLRIIGTISPMLGLLGTILGIITAFQSISIQTGPVSPSLIAEGLWEAMLTTAVGVSIALPALLVAHLFQHLSKNLIDDFSSRLNALSLSFEVK